MTVETVLGRKDVEKLGVIASHEHVFLDVWSTIKAKGAVEEFKQISRRRLFEQKVSMELLGELRLDVTAMRDNVVLDDVELAVSELMAFKKFGGNTIVDLTSETMGRDVVELQKISRLTGLDIITCTGVYLQASHPDWVAEQNEEQLAEYMLGEVRQGIGNTGCRAGVIGEIGASRNVLPDEEKVLRAAAIAQKESGVALYVHTWPFGSDGGKVLDILEKAGADLKKVIICHVDGQINVDYWKSLIDRGAYIGFEHFGKEYRELHPDDIFIIPNDVERLKAIQSLIVADGAYLNKLLFSTDRCLKTELLRYGGFGYAHVLKTILPYMRHLGFTTDQIDTIILKNPKEALATG